MIYIMKYIHLILCYNKHHLKFQILNFKKLTQLYCYYYNTYILYKYKHNLDKILDFTLGSETEGNTKNNYNLYNSI